MSLKRENIARDRRVRVVLFTLLLSFACLSDAQTLKSESHNRLLHTLGRTVTDLRNAFRKSVTPIRL